MLTYLIQQYQMLWGCFENLNDVERFIVCKINAQYQNYQAQIDELVRISKKGYNRHAYIQGSLLPPKRDKFHQKYMRIQFRSIWIAQSITRHFKATNFDKLNDWQRYIAIKLNLQEKEQSLNFYINEVIRLNEDQQKKLSYQNTYICIQDKRKFLKRIGDMNKNINDFIPENRPRLKRSEIKQDPPKKRSCILQMKKFIKNCFSKNQARP